MRLLYTIIAASLVMSMSTLAEQEPNQIYKQTRKYVKMSHVTLYLAFRKQEVVFWGSNTEWKGGVNEDGFKAKFSRAGDTLHFQDVPEMTFEPRRATIEGSRVIVYFYDRTRDNEMMMEFKPYPP